jgi:hypothetical protein
MNKEEVMHPYLSEALAKMRIEDLHREATLFRFTHQVGRHRRKGTWKSALRRHYDTTEGGER